MHPCSWKISILKKEYGKNFVHFDRKNTFEEKIMHYHRSYSAGAHPSFILVKHSRNLLWEERRASVDISFCSVFTQYWVKDDTGQKTLLGTKELNCTEMVNQHTHSYPIEMRSHPQNLSPVPIIWNLILMIMILRRYFKITVWPIEALPSSSSVRGFTFFLMEGLRGIFNNSFRTLCVLFHSIWYSHSNNVSICLILDVTNDILFFHLHCFKLLDRSFYIWMDLCDFRLVCWVYVGLWCKIIFRGWFSVQDWFYTGENYNFVLGY